MKTKIIFAVFAAAVLCSAVWAGASRYVHAKADSNIMEKGVEKDSLATAESFLIGGDKAMGRVELVFEDSFEGAPKVVHLIVNTSDAESADSKDGFSVFLGDKKIGGVAQVARNATLAVALPPEPFAKGAGVTLTLKANGTDGVYIRSLKSGYGPVLELVY